MNARAGHDMKSARELVLVDRCCSIHPKQQLNVKAGILVDDDLRLAEARLRLRGLGIIEQEFMKKLLQVDMVGRSRFLQLLHSNSRKGLQREILPPPTRQDRVTEVLKK